MPSKTKFEESFTFLFAFRGRSSWKLAVAMKDLSRKYSINFYSYINFKMKNLKEREKHLKMENWRNYWRKVKRTFSAWLNKQFRYSIKSGESSKSKKIGSHIKWTYETWKVSFSLAGSGLQKPKLKVVLNRIIIGEERDLLRQTKVKKSRD